MEALTAIAERHSTRTFTREGVPREVLEKMVDAARRAPTARNEQPWGFVVVTEEAKRRALGGLGDYTAPLGEAAACLAVFCKDGKYFLEDGCAAAQNALVAATALGVQSCWIAGDKKPYCPAAAELLGVPKGLRLVALLALGHERTRAGAVEKRALGEVLHWERW
jgi:nitroreductase